MQKINKNYILASERQKYKETITDLITMIYKTIIMINFDCLLGLSGSNVSQINNQFTTENFFNGV